MNLQENKKFFRICDRFGYPYFFVQDFFKYQDSKKWIINGKNIENPIGVFISWAKARKENMKKNGTWRGAKNENWDLTPAVFMGYKKAINPKNNLYIESLISKINKGERLTSQEKDNANLMGIILTIETLKENEPDNKDKTPKRIICENCGLIDFSYSTEKIKFCPRCNKHQLFTEKKD